MGGAHAQDLLSRTEYLLKKYQNHLPENHKTGGMDERRATFGKGGTLSSVTGGGGGDAVDHQRRNQESHSFEQFLGKLEERLDEITDVSEEVRRGKNSLRGEVPKLRKLANSTAKKKRTNKNTNDDIEDESMYERDERETLIDQFEQRIEDVPDGVSRMIPRTPSKKGPHQHKRSSSRDIEMGSMKFNANPLEQPETLREQHLHSKENNNRFEGMEHTEESRQFRQEFEDRKKTQDSDLDEISRGLQTLKRLGADMDEEMARQQPAIENIDFKMENAQVEVKTANTRLKETVEKARSSRHFCIDATLICVLLGIGMYLYRILK